MIRPINPLPPLYLLSQYLGHTITTHAYNKLVLTNAKSKKYREGHTSGGSGQTLRTSDMTH